MADGVRTPASALPFHSSLIKQPKALTSTGMSALPSRRYDSLSESTGSTVSTVNSQSIVSSSLKPSSSSSRSVDSSFSSPRPVSWIECVREATLRANRNVLVNPSIEHINTVIKSIQNSDPSSAFKSDYIYVLDIHPDIIARLKEDDLSFGGTRMTLDYKARCMALRVMPHIQHDQMIWLFNLHLTHQLEEMGLFTGKGDWVGRGSGRVIGDGSMKEPDFSFYPDNILKADGGGIKHPTMTLEIGVSECYRQLQADCQWWPSNTSGRCAQVFLIKATHQPAWKVDFEVWQFVQNARPGSQTRSCPGSVLQKTQHAYCQDGIVHGAPLTLNFELLMGRPPTAPGEQDVIFDSTQLALIAREVRT